MPSWDPQQYSRFSDHRLRPGLDLLARIGDLPAGPIYDLGCGAGALSPLIAARWPDRSVIGIDNSVEMLATAREAAPEIEFLPGDIADWHPPEPAALLFANASLQWLDGHDALFARLMGLLPPGGVLAVQMPRNHDSPSHRLMREAAEAGPWRSRLQQVRAIQPVAEPAAYHRLLAPLAARLEIWESEYLHCLSGPDPVVEWTRGTGLRPYLDRLAGAERDGFLAAYTARIASAYPPEPDGTTLFPFRRIFIVAARAAAE
jgi:trans-aconitate 2-methyltransferase